MSPRVLIDADNGDPIKPVWGVDEQFGAGGQDRVGSGVPGDAEVGRDPAIDIRSITIDLTANITASRDSFPFDGAAAVMR